MPNRKKKIVLPILAGVGLVLLLWLAFHDRSVAATLASGAQDARPSSSCVNSTCGRMHWLAAGAASFVARAAAA